MSVDWPCAPSEKSRSRIVDSSRATVLAVDHCGSGEFPSRSATSSQFAVKFLRNDAAAELADAVMINGQRYGAVAAERLASGVIGRLGFIILVPPYGLYGEASGRDHELPLDVATRCSLFAHCGDGHAAASSGHSSRLAPPTAGAVFPQSWRSSGPSSWTAVRIARRNQPRLEANQDFDARSGGETVRRSRGILKRSQIGG